MLFDLSGIAPFAIVFIAIAAVAALTSVTALTTALVGHHRVRVARHESIPTYYGRFVLAG